MDGKEIKAAADAGRLLDQSGESFAQGEVDGQVPWPVARVQLPSNGANMAFYDVEGKEAGGPVVLCLHGNPTSKFLYRNLVPYLSRTASRVVVPDLVGMGDSDRRPGEALTFDAQYGYLTEFIDEVLGSEARVALVLHDWGSALGLLWASQHPTRVVGICMFEALLNVLDWSEIPFAMRQMFKICRGSLGGFLIQRLNFFVSQMIPRLVCRSLPRAVTDEYRRPYSTYESLAAVRQWPLEVPLMRGETRDETNQNHDALFQQIKWLNEQKDVPVLFLHGDEGVMIPPADIPSFVESIPALVTVIDLGRGKSLLQEDFPATIGMSAATFFAQATRT